MKLEVISLRRLIEEYQSKIFSTGKDIGSLMADDRYFTQVDLEDGTMLRMPKNSAAEEMINVAYSNQRLIGSALCKLSSYLVRSLAINNFNNLSTDEKLGLTTELPLIERELAPIGREITHDYPTDPSSLERFLMMISLNDDISTSQHINRYLELNREVDWDSKPIRRDSFDYVPGDRPQPKLWYQFWK